MQEILSLQVNPSAANVSGKIGGKIQWCRSSSETVQPSRQLPLKGEITREPVVRLLKRSERLHQGLRDILPAVLSEFAWLRPWFSVFLQALTSSLTLPSISDDFIIEVPTRKAMAPAALSRLISRGDSIPLSETTGLSTSPFSARIFSVVDRSNWNVDRLRLLTP